MESKWVNAQLCEAIGFTDVRYGLLPHSAAVMVRDCLSVCVCVLLLLLQQPLAF